jgi:hypothetical protein
MGSLCSRDPSSIKINNPERKIIGTNETKNKYDNFNIEHTFPISNIYPLFEHNRKCKNVVTTHRFESLVNIINGTYIIIDKKYDNEYHMNPNVIVKFYNSSIDEKIIEYNFTHDPSYFIVDDEIYFLYCDDTRVQICSLFPNFITHIDIECDVYFDANKRGVGYININIFHHASYIIFHYYYNKPTKKSRKPDNNKKKKYKMYQVTLIYDTKFKLYDTLENYGVECCCNPNFIILNKTDVDDHSFYYRYNSIPSIQMRQYKFVTWMNDLMMVERDTLNSFLNITHL